MLSTAVAVPLVMMGVVFFWLLFRSQIALLRTRWIARKGIKYTPRPVTLPMNSYPSNLTVSNQIPVIVPKFASSPNGYSPPQYKPLSHFLENALTNVHNSAKETLELKDIPAIDDDLEKDLLDLGYHSVEQIARWGRADVRAVSALLGVEQQIIEEDWIEGARLVLSIG